MKKKFEGIKILSDENIADERLVVMELYNINYINKAKNKMIEEGFGENDFSFVFYAGNPIRVLLRAGKNV